MIPVMGHLGIRLLPVLLGTLVLILFAFKLSGNVSDFSVSASMPSLPSPVNSSESELVQLKDFVDWSWNTVTFPYRKLGEPYSEIPQEGEVVSITDYDSSDGTIKSVTKPVFVFNSDFRESVYKSIDKLDYPALEKMMLKQGKHTSFGYAKSASSSSSERFGILLLFIFTARPAAIISYSTLRIFAALL